MLTPSRCVNCYNEFSRDNKKACVVPIEITLEDGSVTLMPDADTVGILCEDCCNDLVEWFRTEYPEIKIDWM